MNPILALILKFVPQLQGLKITQQGLKAAAVVILVSAYATLCVVSYNRGVERGQLREAVASLTKERDEALQAKKNAEDYVLDMANSKKQSDDMYAELKSRYTVLQKNLLVSNETIRTLQKTPGTADYDLLNKKLTPKVISVANGAKPISSAGVRRSR